jgi:hypothetical protein
MAIAHTSRLGLCALVLLLGSWSVPATAKPLSPEPSEWSVEGKIPKSKDISGIACLPPGDGRRRCLIAVDGGFSAVFVSLGGGTIRVIEKIRLAPETSDQELDAEGVAYDETTKAFYVVGSHGRPRHHCDQDNPSSIGLVRVPVSPTTGRPDYDYKSGIGDPKWVAPQIDLSKHVLAAMKKSPQLAPYVDKCLQSRKGDRADEHGANIEGLAFLGTTVYFGFRGPVNGETAYLLALDRDGLFQSQPPEGTTIPVNLGSGMGVRDLATVEGGLLILSGPEEDVAGSAGLHFFDPSTRAATPLGELPVIQPKAKPEALLVLKETDTKYRVLILSDGVKNGAPTEFSVPKR